MIAKLVNFINFTMVTHGLHMIQLLKLSQRRHARELMEMHPELAELCAVVTLAILESHGEMSPEKVGWTSQNFAHVQIVHFVFFNVCLCLFTCLMLKSLHLDFWSGNSANRSHGGSGLGSGHFLSGSPPGTLETYHTYSSTVSGSSAIYRYLPHSEQILFYDVNR